MCPFLSTCSHLSKCVSTCPDFFPPVSICPACPHPILKCFYLSKFALINVHRSPPVPNIFPLVSICVLMSPPSLLCPTCPSLLPLESSASMGCLSGVMSLKVHRNSTTMSFSFLMGAMCRRSHNGVPVRQVLVVVELVPAGEWLGWVLWVKGRLGSEGERTSG